ncbi:hypothetical protein ODJ79_03100 [Actinoplanes sp. KI2]|uniref:hypothetical protein n=1 Tax=Actinoplanes sp. KI2 TaxID=2983315 RepID=UPI0021D5AC3F|nr:hypothetical protein [Actinoplanes sp. KI2]MCU7722693.1 hypothetical protein [Actinoplanes sp. KI2]
MSTALVARPSPGAQVTAGPAGVTPAPGRRGLLRRVGSLRHTSPGRLQLILGVLVTLGALTGLLAGITGAATSSGTSDLGDRAQPLLVEAETIYSALADADTTAAQAFLAGGLEPAALTQRYNDDLERATTAISAAARLTPDGSEGAASVRALSNGVARYSALVATARADNRQGLPVGSSYLSAASDLNRKTLLPQAQNLFRVAQQGVHDGYSNAASAVWATLLVLMLLGLTGALLLAQRYLSRTTHRTFNVPLVAATVLTAVLGLGTILVLAAQNTHLDRADSTGSTPVAQLAEARILALRERGDEALTLAAHGSGSQYATDFTDASAGLAGALRNEYFSDDLRGKHQAYLAAHDKVSTLDADGSYDDAVKLAIGSQTSQTFESVTAGIGSALDERKAAFTEQIHAAGRGLTLLAVLGPIAALAICMLAGMGIRARLQEYR